MRKSDVKIVQSQFGNSNRYTIEATIDGRRFTMQEEYDLEGIVSVRDDIITREDL